MSLTDDWKSGTLEDGEYYIQHIKGFIYTDSYFERSCELRPKEGKKFETYEKHIKDILARVPSYVEFCAMQQGFAGISKTNESLRELLKECKNIVAHDLWSRAQFPDGQVVEKDDILTRINAAIGESEE